MSHINDNKFMDVLKCMTSWTPDERITLARMILETVGIPPSTPSDQIISMLKPDAPPPADTEKPTKGVPVEQVLGMLRTDQPPPTDEECRRIVEEERWKKYGS